jgi:hypothetical protein
MELQRRHNATMKPDNDADRDEAQGELTDSCPRIRYFLREIERAGSELARGR